MTLASAPRQSSERERRVRSRLFWWSTAFVVYCILLNDYNNWIDECLGTYFLICFSCLVVLMGSSWWIFQSLTARPAFITIVSVTSGVFLTNAINLQARWIWVSESRAAYEDFISCTLWHYRNVPELISLIYLGAIVVSRLWEIEEKRGDRGGE
jgi:hypothetical protein